MKVQSEIEYESPIRIWKEKSTKSNKNWQIIKNGEWTKQNTVVCKTVIKLAVKKKTRPKSFSVSKAAKIDTLYTSDLVHMMNSWQKSKFCWFSIPRLSLWKDEIVLLGNI